MNEPIILSPLEFPFAWVAFLLKWGGALLCVFFAFRLWQVTSARWWLLIGAAFLLSVLSFIVCCVLSGSLPLPHGMASPEVPLPPSTAYTVGWSRVVQVAYDWDITAPVIALALWWAYCTIKPTADPAVSPKGGAATPGGNSEARDGPSSVS
jgi:hypothetical protein